MNDRDKRVADAMLRHCEEIIDTSSDLMLRENSFRVIMFSITPVVCHFFRSANSPNVCRNVSKRSIPNYRGLKCAG